MNTLCEFGTLSIFLCDTDFADLSHNSGQLPDKDGNPILRMIYSIS